MAAVLAALVVGVGSLVGYCLQERSAFEGAARHYVRETVPVLALWNVAVTKTYLAEPERTGTSDDALARAISKMSRLGHLQNAGDPRLTERSYKINPSLGVDQLASYEVPARFDAGPATVTIRILDEDGKFSVLAFNVTTTAGAGGDGGATRAGLSEYHAATGQAPGR